MSKKSVRWGRGFPKVRPCTSENGRASCAPPCGPDRPHLTAPEGPQERRASCAPEARAKPALRSALDLGSRVKRRRLEGEPGFGEAQLRPGERHGACRPRGRTRREARRGARRKRAGSARVFRGTWTYLRKTSGSRREPSRSEGAEPGGPSLWLLSLGQARESNSGAAEATETLRRRRG